MKEVDRDIYERHSPAPVNAAESLTKNTKNFLTERVFEYDGVIIK